MRDDTGRTRGYALYEVLGCARVAETDAYHLRETWLEYGRPAGYPEAPRVRDVFYAIDTLSTVWAECDASQRSMSPCAGEVSFWRFPLRDGATWTFGCCGDAVSEVHARVEQMNATHWRITHADARGQIFTTWIYEPERGLFTAMDGDWGNGPGGWTLRGQGESGRPASEMDPPTVVAACVADDARGPSRHAPVLPPWQASPEGLLVRLSEAVEDPLVGDPEPQPEGLRWKTESGEIRWTRDALVWQTSRDLVFTTQPGAREWLARIIERFAFADASLVEIETFPGERGYDAAARQRVGGESVELTGAILVGGAGELVWRPLHELSGAPTLAPQEAVRLAEAYARCAWPERGGSSAHAGGLVVMQESLARVVTLDRDALELHCRPGEHVFVDAVTGAVLGSRSRLCF